MSRAANSERRRNVAIVLLGVLLATLGLAGGALQVLRAAASEPAPVVPERSSETSAAAPPTVATPAVAVVAVDPAAGVRRQRVGGPSDFPGSLGSAPPAAVVAYQRAAGILESASKCRLDWTVLAAIGRVESDHGRGPALHAPLDGRAGRGSLPDTDGGVIDRDERWDAPVGPMALLPSTWRSVAVDADADGARNPRDLDDAALAAAVLLCSQGRLGDPAVLQDALASYHRAPGFVPTVRALAARYERQAAQVPPPPVVELPLPVLPESCRCLAARPARPGAVTPGDGTPTGNATLVSPTEPPTAGGTSPTSPGTPTGSVTPSDTPTPTDAASPTEGSPSGSATPTVPSDEPTSQETP